jgi:integrase/recombinase XerC
LAERIHIRAWLIRLIESKLEPRSLARKVAAIRSFYHYAKGQGKITKSPVAGITVPKIVKRNPVYVQKSLMMADSSESPISLLTDFKTLRDKLVIELFYGTGMRLAELLGLEWADFNLSASVVRVLGKGNKERLIPIHAELMTLASSYISLLNSEFPSRAHAKLIVTDKGSLAYPMFIQRLVKKSLSEMGSTDRKSPHVLRHTFATHLLNEGADLSAIRELLGHSSLQATQVYTHNSYQKLKDAYAKAHPRAGEHK